MLSRVLPKVQILVAGLVLALPIVFVAFSAQRQSLDAFSFVVEMNSTAPVTAQLFSDSGRGYSEMESIKRQGGGDADLHLYRFPIPPGLYRSFRFNPSDSGGTFVVSALRLEGPSGENIVRFAPDQLKPLAQIARFEVADGRAVVRVDDGNNDPQLQIVMNPPILLKVMTLGRWLQFAASAFALAIASIAFVAWAWPRFDARFLAAPLSGSRRRGAQRLLVLGAIGAALLSCYPVVFFGRSFVAPQFAGVPLVYEAPPYLPGGSITAPTENVHGSDVGASPWQNQPWSVSESHALLVDGEFPLWNRFNSSGIPLLGQGISMLGDPFQLIPIVGGGSAWAWDFKFIAAKAMFVAGNALIVFHLTRSLPLGLLIGLSSAFIGFFLYRINHAGFFTLCYSPWILLPWLKMSTLRVSRDFGGWTVVLTVATVATLASGAIKEAISTILTLHFAGVVCLLAARDSAAEKAKKLLPLVLAAAAVGLITFPLWTSFVATLDGSQTLSDAPIARVFPLRMVGAIFDDLLYFPVSLQQFVTVNCFIGVGAVFALISIRRFRHDWQFAGIIAGVIFACAFAYGLLPPLLIARLPFIGNMQNVYSTFSYPLVVLLIALAGYGFKTLVDDAESAGWTGRYLIVAAIVVALFGLTVAGKGEDVSASLGLPPSGSVQSATVPIVLLLIAALLIPILLRRVVVQRGRNVAVVALAALSLGAVHVRNSMHLETGIPRLDNVLLNPGPRPDFSIPSPALALLPPADREPYRVLGIGGTVFQGYNGTLRLEGISGPDPLVPRRYRDLTNAWKLPLDWGWWLRFDAPAVTRYAHALDFLNVRFVAGRVGSAAELPDLTVRAQSDLDVLERKSAWPRAFFVDYVRVYRDVADFAAMVDMASGPFAAVEETERPSLPARLLATRDAQPVAVSAQNYRLSNNETAFRIEAPGPGMVVLSEGYFPGVTVFVDGIERPIVRINHVFRGVAIDRAGLHNVSFRFNPVYWQRTPLAVILGLGCLGLAVMGSWYVGRRRVAAAAASTLPALSA